MDCTAYYASPLGEILLASDGEALTGLWFAGQKYYAAGLDAAHAERELPIFDATARWLDLYFTGADPAFTPPLNLRGTEFQRMVWTMLLTIPYGGTRSYGELAGLLAEETGRRVSARAVGTAVGRNPVSLIVPCHRVLAADGSLHGYAGGLRRKEALLRLETERRPIERIET